MTIEKSLRKLVSSDVVKPVQELVAVARSGNLAVSQTILSTIHDLSIIVPTRNEHDNIWPLLESLRNALHGLRVEVIFVDDSDDDTPEIITSVAETMNSSLFHIRLEHRLAGAARSGGLATADALVRARACRGFHTAAGCRLATRRPRL